MNTPAKVVLVVDDETLLRFYAVDIFADRGFSTFEATTSAEALEVIVEHPEISVVLTDSNMPGDMDGLELAGEICRRWPDIQIIVASGKMRPTADELPPGGQFVSKPFSPNAVLELVGHAPAERAALTQA